jgi:hypothetical protein
VIKFNIPDSGNVFISFPLIIYPFPEEATFYHDPVKIIQRSTVFPYTLERGSFLGFRGDEDKQDKKRKGQVI